MPDVLASSEIRKCKKCGKADRSPSGNCRPCSRKADEKRRPARREEAKERSRVWREQNPERFRKAYRGWQEANRERTRQNAKKWSQDNSDRVKENKRAWREKNRARLNALIAEYRKSNPGIRGAERAARRVREKGQRIPLTADQRRQIRDIYKKCKQISAETGILHHVDHIMPLAGKNCSGLHVPWNLQIIPAVDNVRKSNKVFFDG